MRLSIIIPAFNEEKYIAGTILALNHAVDACNRQLDFSEIVVCDNNSTDRTSEICKELGAVVVFEPHNQISRARNSGAKAAKGDWFLFVDADTIVSVETLQELIDCVLTGRFAGGGGQLQMDTRNRLAKFVAFFLIRLFRLLKWAGGAFVFCRADAFQEIGGFDEEYYAGEEVFFCRKLKRWGRAHQLGFAFLTKTPIMTSARKLKTHGLGPFFKLVIRGIFRPRSTISSREHLDFFYDGKR